MNVHFSHARRRVTIDAVEGRPWPGPISGHHYRRLSPGPGRSREAVGAHQRARLHAATVELVAERGYSALTVRGLSRRAGVSSGDFYRHFVDGEDCFLRTYGLLLEGVAERLVVAAGDETNPRRRLTLALEVLAGDLARAPQAARFLLIAAPAAGPPRLAALRRSVVSLGAATERCLGRETMPPLPSPVLEGIGAALLHLARSWVIGDRAGDPAALAAPVADWVVALHPHDVRDLDQLFRPAQGKGNTMPGAPDHRSRPAPVGDEREMILAAAAELAARRGYGELSVPRIRRAAGVSRKTFDSHFEGVQDCFLASLRLRAERALSGATRQAGAGASWARSVYHGLEVLCAGIAGDPLGARASFVELFAAGPTAIEQRSRLISDVAGLLRTGASSAEQLGQVEAEATTAAVWTLLLRTVEDDPTETASLLPAVAYLALAPAIGASAAMRTIQEEQGRPGNRKTTVTDGMAMRI